MKSILMALFIVPAIAIILLGWSANSLADGITYQQAKRLQENQFEHDKEMAKKHKAEADSRQLHRDMIYMGADVDITDRHRRLDPDYD